MTMYLKSVVNAAAEALFFAKHVVSDTIQSAASNINWKKAAVIVGASLVGGLALGPEGVVLGAGIAIESMRSPISQSKDVLSKIDSSVSQPAPRLAITYPSRLAITYPGFRLPENAVASSAAEPVAISSSSKKFSSRIPVPVKKPAPSVAISTASEVETTSKVKNKLENFIAAIKVTTDSVVLAKLKKLSAFDFQNPRKREALGKSLGVDLSNLHLADSSIQRIRVTAGRNPAMKAA